MRIKNGWQRQVRHSRGQPSMRRIIRFDPTPFLFITIMPLGCLSAATVVISNFEPAEIS